MSHITEPHIEAFREEIKQAVREATQAALVDALFMFGIDVSTPEAIQNFRKDMAHTRECRESVEQVKKKGLLTAVTVLVVGILGYLALPFTQFLPHN